MGFLSTFLIELLGRLEQDPMDIIQDVLIYQMQMMRNSSLGPYVPPDFSPPEHIVVVNALFYTSLGVMLLAAFIAMLIKSWVREFDRGLRTMLIPEQRVKTREFHYLGMERWKLPKMVGILPSLIQVSLLLFAIGLILFLLNISKPAFGVTTAIFGVGVLFYAITTSISVFVTSSPFHSPLSRALGKVYQHVHAYFCPKVNVFLSKAMDTAPATALGRFRRDIQIILQKSRPYLENNFIEPIAATTMDEVQISMATSALQRIHESAPNSQHSETLQRSVWRVAGGTNFRVPPSFNPPSWILDRRNDAEYFAHLPPAMLVELVAVWLRTHPEMDTTCIYTIRAVLQRVNSAKIPWPQLVIGIFDTYGSQCYWSTGYISNRIQMKPSEFTNMIRRRGLLREESIWLLSTLSDICIESWTPHPSIVEICLTVLLGEAQKWREDDPPDTVLLEAVVALTTISCSSDTEYQLRILSNSRQHPWLLQNLRNPDLIIKLFKDAPSRHHEQLTSLLFLVTYFLARLGSGLLAARYFAIVTVKGDFPLYTSALTAITPAIGRAALFAIGMSLVAPQAPNSIAIPDRLRPWLQYPELFTNYDRQLGGCHHPDHNFVAILLVLSEYRTRWAQNNPQLNLKTPWLRLAARLDVPDGSGTVTESIQDHRVYTMIAALSLLRYTTGTVTQYREPLLLASFLGSREWIVSFVALKYYLRTMTSNSNLPMSPCYFSRAVHAAFNFMLPDHQLRMGWEILEVVVNGFENLPAELRRILADAFFTLSHQRLLQSQEGTETKTPRIELKEILTWEYFHKTEREATSTDLDFSGLDWMAMAWSLRLSQKAKRNIGRPPQEVEVTEEFVLQALCKLLEAAPYHRIIPIIPKLSEFVQWFDDTDFHEYGGRVTARIEEAARMHLTFYKFNCMWYI